MRGVLLQAVSKDRGTINESSVWRPFLLGKGVSGGMNIVNILYNYKKTQTELSFPFLSAQGSISNALQTRYTRVTLGIHVKPVKKHRVTRVTRVTLLFINVCYIKV